MAITAEHLKVVVEAETKDAEAGYKRVEARGDALSAKLGGMSKIADAASASLKTVANPAITSGLTNAGKAADDVAGSMKRAAKGASDFGNQKGDIKATGDAIAGAGKQAGGLGDMLAKLGLQGMGIQSIKTAVMGLAAPFQNAMSLAGDLQQSIANISTIKLDLDTTKAFADLNQLSTIVPETATGLADAMYNIFSSIDVGYDDALKLTESFAKGATAAQTSAETFGTSILGVMNAYGLAASDATHISDVFFNTVNKGVITGQELAASLGPVTQSAKAAGLSLDELGGFIAGVTKEGGPAAQNVNNLNNFLSKVTTKDAQAALEGLGIKMADTSGNFRPMVDVLGDLKQRLAGMTAAAKLSAIQAIFPDAQARQGAMVLMSQLDMVKATIESNRTATGTAAAAYEKMSNTYNTQTKLMQNTMDKAWREMGAQLLPAITPIITAFAEQIPAAMQKAGAGVEFMQKHAEQIKPILLLIGSTALAVVTPGLIAMGISAAGAAASFTVLAAAEVAAAAPLIFIGLIAAGIVLTLSDLRGSLAATFAVIGKIPGMGWAKDVAADMRAADIAARAAAERFGEVDRAYANIQSNPAIAQLPGLFDNVVKSGATLTQQVDFLNLSYRSFVEANNTAVTAATALAQAGQSGTDAFTKQQVAVYTSASGMKQIGAEAKTAGFAIVTLADGTKQFVLSADQMAAKAKAIGTAMLDTAGVAVPFGSILADIEKKAAEGANKIQLMQKAVHDLAGEMTGAEQVMGRQSKAWDAVVSSAQALTTNRTPDAIATITARAKEMLAATDANAPSMKTISGLIDAVAKGGPAGAAAFETLKKKVDEAKKPIDDLSKSMSDERGVAGDLASEQLGLGKSMDALKQALIDMVGVFQLSMGQMPPLASKMSADVLAAFAISGQTGSLGAQAGAAFAAGLRLQAADVARAARQVADGSINQFAVSLDAHSPSRVMKQYGVWADEGYAGGLIAGIPLVRAAAKQMTDEGTAPIKSGVQTMIDVMVQSVPAVSALAASLASLSNNSMRPLLQQVANFDVAIAQLKVKLANTTAESEEAKAIQKQIDALERAKLAYSSTIDAHAAYQRALELARTPADVFSARRGEITQRATNVTNYGEGGANIVDNLMASLTDPAQAGRLADGVNTLLGSQAFKDLPNAGALGTEIWDAALRALNDPSPVNMQWLLNLLGQAETQTRTRIEAMKPTFQTALADALSFDTLSGQVGSSTATLFTNTAAAIDAGKELPIQALGRFRADSIAELTKLPTDMQTSLGPQMQAAWDEFVANPSKEALAKLQGIYGQIHAATAIIPAGYAAMLPDAQAFINQFVQMNRDGALSVEEAHERAGAAAMLFPKGLDRMMPEVQTRFAELRRLVTDGSLTVVQAGERAQAAAGLYPAGLRKMLPETQNLIRMIGASYLSGAISIEDATDRIADAQNIIPDGLRKMTPGVQAEIANIVEAWRRGALDIRTANEMIADAAKRSADATAAAAADMEKSLSRLIALQYQAGHQAVQSGPTNTSMTGGPQGTDISSSIVSNYAGILGLIASTITDSFGTFINYSFPQALVDAYGGNIAAILYDLDHHLGVFMTQEEINTRLGLSAANLNTQAAIAAGQASHTNQGAANTNNTAAAAIANAAIHSTNASEMFGAHVDGFGNIVNDLGQLLSAAPGSGDEISERAMNERRRQWEKENPGKGPAPFRSGGFIPNYTGLVNMGTGKLFGTMAEPGTGGEYIVPKSAMRALSAPNSTQSSAVSGSSAAPVHNVTQNVTLNITQLPGEDARQLAERTLKLMNQKLQSQY